MIRLIRRLMVLALFIVTAQAATAQLPAYYPEPESFTWAGTVDGLSLSKGRAIIGDYTVQLSPAVRVYTLESPNGSTLDLKVGHMVGCVFAKDSDVSKITHIYILPDGYQIPGYD